MSSKLIQLQDGIFVEVEIPGAPSRQLSGSFADRVNANIDKIKPILANVARPILETWNVINQDVFLEQAEVALGLNFDVEGNLYITKASIASSITIKLVLKPLDHQTGGVA